MSDSSIQPDSNKSLENNPQLIGPVAPVMPPASEATLEASFPMSFKAILRENRALESAMDSAAAIEGEGRFQCADRCNAYNRIAEVAIDIGNTELARKALEHAAENASDAYQKEKFFFKTAKNYVALGDYQQAVDLTNKECPVDMQAAVLAASARAAWPSRDEAWKYTKPVMPLINTIPFGSDKWASKHLRDAARDLGMIGEEGHWSERSLPIVRMLELKVDLSGSYFTSDEQLALAESIRETGLLDEAAKYAKSIPTNDVSNMDRNMCRARIASDMTKYWGGWGKANSLYHEIESEISASPDKNKAVLQSALALHYIETNYTETIDGRNDIDGLLEKADANLAVSGPWWRTEEARENLAVAYAKTGDIEKAHSYLKLMKHSPDIEVAVNAIARRMLDNGQDPVEVLETANEKLKQISPERGAPWYQESSIITVAGLYAEAGYMDKAQELETWLVKETASARLQTSLGLVAASKGNDPKPFFDKALDVIKPILNQNRYFSSGRSELGVISQAQAYTGNIKDATASANLLPTQLKAEALACISKQLRQGRLGKEFKAIEFWED